MRTGYEEWAAARAPALLRFAYLLTGDVDDAEQLAADAMRSVGAGWPRVVRTDDPDRLVRHLMAERCPPRFAARVPVAVGGEADPGDPRILAAYGSLPVRRRAAVVLRLVEDRSDDEIADVLETSVASVHTRMARAHDVVRAALAGTVSDPGPAEVDQALGSELRELARSAPVQLRDALPEGATEEGDSKRGGALFAVAAVVLLLATITIANKATSTPDGVIRYPHIATPSTWRTESYDGVQLQVPAGWGWGAAPIRSDIFHHHLGACGANVADVEAAGGDSSTSTSTPFVGRPAALTYVCVPWGSDGVFPTADAVWFASPLRVGIKGVEGGNVAETRAIGGQRVTVFSHDQQLRRQILGSAHAVELDSHGCPTAAVVAPAPGPTGLRPASMSVCVYSQDTGTTVLQWSGEVGEAATRAYLAAVAAAPSSSDPCGSTPSQQWVTLGIHDAAGRGIRWDVVDLGCGGIVGPVVGEAALTPALVSPWATGGIHAYVLPRPSIPADVASYFHAAVG